METLLKQKFSKEHMGTGRVPWKILASEWCPGTHGHRNSVWAHVGTGWVQENMLTGRVPGHIRSLEKLPGTYWNQNGARHICAPEGCPTI